MTGCQMMLEYPQACARGALLGAVLAVIAVHPSAAQTIQVYAFEPDASTNEVDAKRTEWHGSKDRYDPDDVDKSGADKPFKFFPYEGHDQVTGSSYADVYIKGDGENTVNLGPGDDIFDMSGADTMRDILDGGDGTDSIIGSNGDDVVSLKHPDNIEIIDLKGGYDILEGHENGDHWDLKGNYDSVSGVEEIRLGGKSDVLTDTDATHTIRTGAHEDTVWAEGGADVVILPAPRSYYTILEQTSSHIELERDNGHNNNIYDAAKIVFDGGSGTEIAM